MSEEIQDPTVEDPEEGQDEYTPPSKEEWERVQRTLAARKKERDEARREAAKAREEAAKGPGADAATAAAQEAQAKLDNQARRSSGITALMEAGMTKAQAKEAVGLLKLKDLVVDEDGDVDGVEDAVADLKAKFPGMFAKESGEGGKAKPPKARTTDGGGRDGGTQSATDRTTAKMMAALGLK